VKPEVAFLEPGELGEVFPLEPAAGYEWILSKTKHSVAQRWPMPAARAVPLCAFKVILAGEAAFHAAIRI
jgi:hypothetical protein